MKKILSIIPAIVTAAFLTISCGKADPTPTPPPTPTTEDCTYHVDFSISITEDLQKLFDFTGSKFICGSTETDFGDLLSFSSGFSALNVNGDAPCNTSYKLVLIPKKDFEPVSGKTYDVITEISYKITTVSKTSGKTVSSVIKPDGISIKGVDFSEAKEKGYSVEKVLNTLKNSAESSLSFSISKDGSIQQLFQ